MRSLVLLEYQTYVLGNRVKPTVHTRSISPGVECPTNLASLIHQYTEKRYMIRLVLIDSTPRKTVFRNASSTSHSSINSKIYTQVFLWGAYVSAGSL